MLAQVEVIRLHIARADGGYPDVVGLIGKRSGLHLDGLDDAIGVVQGIQPYVGAFSGGYFDERIFLSGFLPCASFQGRLAAKRAFEHLEGGIYASE